jgi:hypothetical protein
MGAPHVPLEAPLHARRMGKHRTEFMRFVQDYARLPNGDLRPDVIELVTGFWKERGFLMDWQLVHGQVLAFTRCVFVENLS